MKMGLQGGESGRQEQPAGHGDSELSPLGAGAGEKPCERAVDIEITDESPGGGVNPVLRQLAGAGGCNILPICSGMILGYSAILFPQLKAESIVLSKEEESWIASMAPLQMVFGSLASGLCMERFGRKYLNISSAMALILGWVFVYLGASFGMLLTGRLITGFCLGLGGSSSIAYIGEVCEPRLRGFFLACISMSIAFGLLLVHLLGTFLHWRTVALLCMLMPVVSVVLCSVAPESYVWFVKRGRLDEARRSFAWFRGHGREAREELAAVLQRGGGDGDRTVREVWGDCCTPQFIKPFLILNLFFAVMQLSGNNAVAFYSVSIMQSTVPGLNEYASMLVVDVLRLVMGAVACVLTKRYRVRPLTLVSTFGTAFALYFIATFAALSQRYPDNGAFSYVALGGFAGYIIIISVGLVPLPWLICGEILPPATKGIGSGVSTSLNFLVIFLVVKTNPAMFEHLGDAGTYSVYGTITLIGGILLYKVLPETKNKTLKEIEMMFL